MKIFATADLHYTPKRKQEMEKLALDLKQSKADVFILAGDISSLNDEHATECLSHFDSWDGLKLAVPGNHDVWAIPGSNSVLRYTQTLPAIFKQHNFHLLDQGPVIKQDIGFVGNMGWYDYSFRITDEHPRDPIVLQPNGPKKLKDVTSEEYANKWFDLSKDRIAQQFMWNDGVNPRIQGQTVIPCPTRCVGGRHHTIAT